MFFKQMCMMKRLWGISLLALCTWFPAMGQTADPLEGKSIGVMGDSYVRNHREPVEKTWHYKFARKHGMRYFNYGRNGNCISVDLEQWGPGMWHRYTDMADSLDYVVVVGGHNDAARLDQIGPELFEQRLDELCEGLVERYPRARILFFTPWTCKDFEGSNRQKVVDAMLRVCGNHGIPVFDAARRSGIHADSDRFRACYFQNGGRGDTAHLNSAGHDRFLPVAEAFILQYVPR